MLLNLLGNAAKFTQNGTIMLTVRREQTQDTELVRFAITDSGIGMSPEQEAQLFQPFIQGDSSSTRKYGGVGLGLALSQRLCQLMGGAITVQSTPHIGSTFTVSIPVNPQTSKENRA